jgi:hypothetical protein
MSDNLRWIRAESEVVRAPAKNYSTDLLVLWPVYCVTSANMYPDMRRWMCLVDKP